MDDAKKLLRPYAGQLLMLKQNDKKSTREPSIVIAKSMKRVTAAESPKPAIILVWTGFYGSLLTNDMLKNCPITNCYVTSNRQFLQQSSAIMFHPHDLSPSDLPPKRDAKQLYVAFFWEPPPYMAGPLQKTPPNFFNLSLNYRLDSDVYAPYVSVHRRSPTVPFQPDNFLKVIRRKRKTVAWFVGNCQTPSRREIYVNELKKYISVDIYGRCGTLQCKIWSQECEDLIRDNYKFYLSFENAICRDYVTEKFYRAVSNYAIPVVLKRKVYEDLHFPDSSFIAVDDFSSPEYLAEFLLYLDKNEQEYLKYFKWNWLYYFENHSLQPTALCGLCRYLQNLSNAATSSRVFVKDMRSWVETSASCSQVEVKN